MLAVTAAAAFATAAAGCGSSTTSGSSGASSAGSSGEAGRGTVSVLYAGSLVNVMEHDLGPAFTHADGYGFEGVGAGSTELVAQIKGGIRQADVFISASAKANAGLEGASNGDWESWYVTFARTPLVIGYNPSSRFASQLRSKPWYQVITEPGIRVGRTDPKLDPKGKLTVEALEEAARTLQMPSLAHALSAFDVFPEESLVGRLEAGQLDAGFFYADEAQEQHIRTVPLTPVAKSATYTVTILKRAPDRRGAQAFVSFLLGPRGRAILSRHGLVMLSPKLTGSIDGPPASVRSLIGG
jgi:molybdate/tungstate transport system substrate-binding protein